MIQSGMFSSACCFSYEEENAILKGEKNRISFTVERGDCNTCLDEIVALSSYGYPRSYYRHTRRGYERTTYTNGSPVAPCKFIAGCLRMAANAPYLCRGYLKGRVSHGQELENKVQRSIASSEVFKKAPLEISGSVFDCFCCCLLFDPIQEKIIASDSSIPRNGDRFAYINTDGEVISFVRYVDSVEHPIIDFGDKASWKALAEG